MNLHLVKNGQQAGPYDENDLRQRVAAGEFNGDSLAWQPGMANWQPLRELMPALFAPAAPAPPPPVAPPPSPATPPAPTYSPTPYNPAPPPSVPYPSASPNAPAPYSPAPYQPAPYPTGPGSYQPGGPAPARSGCGVGLLIAGLVFGLVLVGLIAAFVLGYRHLPSNNKSNTADDVVIPAARAIDPDTQPAHELYAQAAALDGDQKYDESFKLYQQAADQGNLLAMEAVGVAYINGEGVAKDATAGYNWTLKAANAGSAHAQANLAVDYIEGNGVAKDVPLGLRWLRNAAGSGEVYAQIKLATYLLGGGDVPYDAVEAYTWYRKAADQGDADAQVKMGYAAYTGSAGVAWDYDAALDWMKKAYDQGNTGSYAAFGLMNLAGRGTPRNSKEAFTWFNKAVESAPDDEEGYAGRAACYLYGAGVTKDQAKALEDAQKAADGGNDDGNYVLGLIYYFGLGVAQDNAKALELFQKADEISGNTHCDAEAYMGHMSLRGDGVTQDYAQALSWLRKAAVSHNVFWDGESVAAADLGSLYENGYGTAKNLPQALYWYKLSQERGFDRSKEAIARLNAAGVTADTKPLAVATPTPRPTVARTPTPRPMTTPFVFRKKKR